MNNNFSQTKKEHMLGNLAKFLQSSTVEEITPSKRAGGPRKAYQPDPTVVAIRVHADGSVFPSAAAIDKFELEYKSANVKKESLPLKEGQSTADQKYKNVYDYINGTGNGFDVIDTRTWGNQFKSTEDGGMLFVVPVPKTQAKVDLFGTANYDEAGKPKVSVTEQGAATFGKEVLIPAIEALYGIRFAVNASPTKPAKGKKPAVEEVAAIEGVDFVDMEITSIVEGVNVTEAFSQPILYVPKRIVRGKDAGKSDYERRENTQVYGFIPMAAVEKSEDMDDSADINSALSSAALAASE